ncbi:MAG TPA: alanine racemase [Dehalococcoidia bacterium]|nr:alanine racemase [Dehalococcoidia bacterium]
MAIPRKLSEIPTPALIIDLPAMDRNIRRMAEFFADGPCKVRPHFKAHKTPEIARRQLAAGSCTGLTCATVGEAEIAAAFCDDILIANEIIGTEKCARVAALAGSIDLKIAVDSEAGLREMAAAATSAGTTVGVLVDVDVGLPRCGIAPGEPALALARLLASTSGVELRGLMGYEGHVVGIPDRDERTAGAAAAMEKLTTTALLLRDAGLSCEIVSAGGTGTYDITGRTEGVTEIQAGSYVLMDTAYAKLDIPFEQAFSVLGTVISRPRSGLCVTDSGHKACTEDHGNPDVRDLPGASVLFLSDEHATISVPADSIIKVGDHIRLWPSHIDPTINLHDVFYVQDGDTVVDAWPVAARGYSEHRRKE